MLQATNVVYPDGTKLTNFYALDGQVRQTGGSRAYAVGYSFDGQGRMTTMTNWTSFPSSGAEVTTCNYDQYRGWLTSKLDNSGYGPTYTHTYAGRLASRTWARGTNTTYSYDAGGSQIKVVYNDGTPGVTNTYDRLGRLSTAFCGLTTTTRAYDSANDLLSETNSGGTLDKLSITNGYDAYLRRTNSVVFGGGGVLAKTTNSYDAASRVAVVSDGTNTGTYSYLANSPLVDHIVLAHSGASVMTNQNTYDYVNRLTGKNSVLTYNYQYNTAGQRTKTTLIDGSYWNYGYDSLGQNTSGKKYFWDNTPTAGEQFTYSFDTIGNRTQTQAGGDQTGSNLRVAGYTNNALNQITSRGVPGYVDVIGLNLATNTVSVNTTNAYQKWEYFREQMGTNNTSAAQYVPINVTAAGQTTVSGNVFLPQTPENYTYDFDGNLTQDGRWTYTWDAENHLVNMTSLSSAPTASKYELAFTYDYQGRRIQKQVWTNSGSAYVAQSTNLFEYDGWNLAAIVTSNNLLAASLVWGTDLSGTRQGAGGVGGLLCENLVGNGVHFPAYDGNGNVMALVSATSSTVTANYEYGPFGELLRITGSAGKANPIRFSTKYDDDESGLLYYGYRYYDPSTGKWRSRDPIGEKGGANLSAILGNDPMNCVDNLGLKQVLIWASAYIPYSKFVFQYAPDPWVPVLDPAAIFSGDGRTGPQIGGSSRAYHLLTIETDPSKPPVVRNVSGGGISQVWWGGSSPFEFGKLFYVSAVDLAPPQATVTRVGTLTRVVMHEASGDPLVWPQPDIHYDYTLVFGANCGKLHAFGEHGWYPAFDLIINSGNGPNVLLNYTPSGGPFDLLKRPLIQYDSGLVDY